MGWESRSSTTDDIANICNNLADRLRLEFEIAEGLMPGLDIIANTATLISRGCARTYIKDGRCLVILAWDRLGADYSTVFIAREEYFAGVLSDIRYTQRSIADLQIDLGNARLVANSLGEHRARDAWFRLMGYKKQEVQLPYAVFVREPSPLIEMHPCMAGCAV